MYNRCLNYLRSSTAGIGKGQTLTDENDTVTEETPLGELMAKELEEEMQEAIDSLPEATRRVFLLHRSDGLKYEEITTVTGISVNTVKYHIKRALAILRRRFGISKPTLP